MLAISPNGRADANCHFSTADQSLISPLLNGVATASFPIFKKFLSVLLWLTLIVPILAFIHKKITGRMSAVWAFLLWQNRTSSKQPAPHPPAPLSTEPVHTTSTSGESPITSPASKLDEPPPISPAQEPDKIFPATDVSVIDVNQGPFLAKIEALLDATSLDSETKKAILANAKWMVDHNWRLNFIEKFITISIEMENNGLFNKLPRDLAPQKWFLVPKAHKKQNKILISRGRSMYGLWKKSYLKSMEKCKNNYRKFLATKNLDLDDCEHKFCFTDKRRHNYGTEMNNHPLDLAIAAIIYPPETKFCLQYTPDKLDEVFRNRNITLEEAENFLAAQYAYAQGIMRHVQTFPGREGDMVHIYDRFEP
ncbi:MAG: hypothetical protein LBD72_00660, partial [Puniceicoccales bacterium]|nr:hypothetical protein [Puniceicoccales bacterium]